MKERRAPQPVVARCKLVLVGDVQCGKTAMLQVLAKDCYPEVSCLPAPLASFSPCPPARCPGIDSHLPRRALCPVPTPPHPTLCCFLAGGLPCLSFPLRPVPLLPPRWCRLLLTSSPIGPGQIPSYLPVSGVCSLERGLGAC